MKFINEDDLTDENFATFCKEIDKIREECKQQQAHLNESSLPPLGSLKEVLDYFHKRGGLSFSEWENKMREKYDI